MSTGTKETNGQIACVKWTNVALSNSFHILMMVKYTVKHKSALIFSNISHKTQPLLQTLAFVIVSEFARWESQIASRLVRIVF